MNNRGYLLTLMILGINVGCSLYAPDDFSRPATEREAHVMRVTRGAWIKKGVKYGNHFCDVWLDEIRFYASAGEEIRKVCDQVVPADQIGGCYIDNHYESPIIVYNWDYWFPDDFNRLIVHETIHAIGDCSGVEHYTHKNPLLWQGAETAEGGKSVERMALATLASEETDQ